MVNHLLTPVLSVETYVWFKQLTHTGCLVQTNRHPQEIAHDSAATY